MIPGCDLKDNKNELSPNKNLSALIGSQKNYQKHIIRIAIWGNTRIPYLGVEGEVENWERGEGRAMKRLAVIKVRESTTMLKRGFTVKAVIWPWRMDESIDLVPGKWIYAIEEDDNWS